MRRIPVVDDDSHICLAIRAWLKRYGFKVAIADGGASGLLALDNSTFDLMIVDIFMPNMRGFESIRVFHDHAPTVPLIAIPVTPSPAWSGPSSDFLRIPFRLDATRCLRKPFRPATLLSEIDECLSEAEPHRRYVATLAAVTNAGSEQSSHEPREGVFHGSRLSGFDRRQDVVPAETIRKFEIETASSRLLSDFRFNIGERPLASRF